MLRQLLLKQGVKAGTGWEGLLAKLTSKESPNAELESLTGSLATEQICCGDGYFQIFTLGEDGAIAGWANSAKSLVAQDCELLASYPAPTANLPEIGLTYARPMLMEVRALSGGDIALIFCAKRSVFDRQTYDSADVTSEIRQAYPGIDQFITVRRLSVQTYDVVYLRPSLNRIEVKTDSPHVIKDQNVEEYFESIYLSVESLVPGIGLNFHLGDDLFPVVGNMYGDHTLGKVVSLGHHADTGRVSKDKMIGTGAVSKDLRDEKGHAASMKECADVTTCFSITVELADPGFHNPPTLTLPGRHIHTTGISLRYGQISTCGNQFDFRLAINKVVSHLS